ncbi:arginase [Aliiroseovarius halocynthiae]|uniref:Arginase n=1 Tax=Aliiroseovarius halocynthiae TaxID=985055 RepID=A0A545SRF2_9RHOB|nr:arginase [Aliiroseovarius halocynthiae]TQV67550.1 arginase [Aliiroseovarius halocynthiae]SMR81564.1 arginase [Aliiroseovarius halocynthiae]
MTNIHLLGVPLEEGAGRRGCIMGPDAYRTAGLAEELAALGHNVTDLGDAQRVDTGPIETEHNHLKFLPEVAGWTRSLHDHAFALAGADTLPIYLGGDHALALGTVTGHVAAAAQMGRPQYVLWLDAHSDFNTPASSPSGNIHGMPMAFACGLDGFPDLLGKPLPAVLDPQKLCMMGLRSVDREERELLQSSGVQAHDMRAIDEHGVARILRPFLDEVSQANGLLHVSLDVDFIEPEIAPAVGTTVPGGATFREAHLIMEMLHDSGLVTSLDLVELNPFLDERGRTARLMVDLTASLFGRRVLDRFTTSY